LYYYIDVNTHQYYCCTVTARRKRLQPRPATLKQPRNFGRWVQIWLGWGTGTPSLLPTSHHRPARLHKLCGWRAVALHVVDVYMWQAVPVVFVSTVILIWHPEDRASRYILIIKPPDALIPQIYFWNTALHVSDSFSVHHHESSTANQCFSTSVRQRPGKFFFQNSRARSQQIYS
jgi:hypothetical protein